MRRIVASSALALAIAVPSLAAAQEINYSAGATVASKYVFKGVQLSKAGTFQPWIEAEYNGIYGNLWATNMDKHRGGFGASAELDVTLGYRNEYAGLNYEFGYTRYLVNNTHNYVNPLGADQSGEIFINLAGTAYQNLDLALKTTYNPKSERFGAVAIASYAVDEQLSFNVAAGQLSHHDGHDFFSVGAAYAINDQLTASVNWIDTDENIKGSTLANGYPVPYAKNLWVASLDYKFSFR